MGQNRDKQDTFVENDQDKGKKGGRQSHVGIAAAAAAFGAAAGAAAVILSDKKNREMMAKTLAEWKEKASGIAGDVKTKMDETVDTTEKKVQEMTGKDAGTEETTSSSKGKETTEKK